MTDAERIALYERLAAFNACNPEALGALRQLAHAPDSYQRAMEALQNCLPDPGSTVDAPPAPDGANSGAWKGLYSAAAKSARVCQFLRQAPPLAGAAPDEVAILAEFADAVPDPGLPNVLRTRDACFARIWQTLLTVNVVVTSTLLREDLSRLLAAHFAYPAVMKVLLKLAQSEQWSAQIVAVERHFGLRPIVERPDAQFSAEGQRLVEELEKLPAPESNPPAESTQESGAAHFLDAVRTPPSLSALLREEVLAFAKIRGALNLSRPLDAGLLADTLLRDPTARGDGLKGLPIWPPASLRPTIKLGLKLRILIAKRLMRARQVAKVDVLRRRWPRLYDLLVYERQEFLDLERLLVPPPPPDGSKLGASGATDGPPRWANEVEDKTLRRFLRLRPCFREMLFGELQSILRLGPPEAVPAGVEPAREAPPRAREERPARPLELSYTNLFLTFRSLAEEKAGGNLEVTLDDGVKPIHNPVELSGPFLSRLADELPKASEDLSQSGRRSSWEQIGQRVYELFFAGPIGERFEGLYQTEHSILRLLVDTAGMEDLDTIPWEALYVPRLRLFVGQRERFSLLRHLPSDQVTVTRPLASPLRVLAVFASPRDLPGLAPVEPQAELLTKVLASAGPGPQLQVQILPGKDATLAKVNSMLAELRPQVLHYVGPSPTSDGALYLLNEGMEAERVLPSELGGGLREAETSIVVFAGRDPAPRAVSGFAGEVLNTGINAMLTPLRKVPDRAMLTFTGRFYSQLAGGATVERAVIEARRALAEANEDWPAFALYSRSTDLQNLRLVG